MIIYLDESKRLGKGQIVIGGFFSNHNTHYIEKFIEFKKQKLNISKNIELKSTNKFGKIFIKKMSDDFDFNKLDIITFGFHFENYFFDSSETYINLLLKIILDLTDNLKIKDFQKITIVHDNINAKDNNFVSRKIESFLKNKGIKFEFKIHNSKKYLSLQLADLIVGEYKKLYFFDDVNFLDNFLELKDFKNKKT